MAFSINSNVSNRKIGGSISATLLLWVFLAISASAAPVANAGSDMTVFAGEALRLDGSASQEYITESQYNGTWSVRWSTGDGYDSENIIKTPHVYMTPGVYTASLSVKNASGEISTDTVRVNVLPVGSASSQILADSGNPETNRLNLQAAIDAAALNPAESEIVVPAGFEANDPIIVPARRKSFGAYVTVRVADLSNLPALKRVGREDRAKLFRLHARAAAVSGYNAALIVTPDANYFRFIGLNIYRTGAYKNDIISIDTDAAERKASHIIFDRLILDGNGSDTVRGFRPNGENISLLNSSIYDIKIPNVESKAIGQWSGNGPIAIVNNRLEAASINFLVGGTTQNYDTEILDGLVFRGNHSWKSREWVGPNGESLGYAVKNQWELKHGKNTICVGNIFENNYTDAQTGDAILIKSAAQDTESNRRAEVANLDFRNNKVLNTRGGFNVTGIQSWIAPHPPIANHIRFYNNLFEERDGRGNLILTPDYFELNHNTFIARGAKMQGFYIERSGVQGQADYQGRGFKMLNNLVYNSLYGSVLANTGAGTAALDYGYVNHDVRANVFAGANAPGAYPSGNFFPTLYESLFTDYANGIFTLPGGSPYERAATDGANIGANMTALNAAVSPAVTGLWTTSSGGGTTSTPTPPAPTPNPYPTPTGTALFENVQGFNVAGNRLERSSSGAYYGVASTVGAIAGDGGFSWKFNGVPNSQKSVALFDGTNSFATTGDAVFLNGAYKTDWTFDASQTFRFERVGGTVRLYQGSRLVYQSAAGASAGAMKFIIKVNNESFNLTEGVNSAVISQQ
ncbi:MAG TPA: PKD domain-containing protein [Pyrinomonadaceae bacterium]